MKRIFIVIIALCAMVFYKTTYASGLFFNVAASGNPGSISVTLCLNAKGPLSCQTYNVSSAYLSLLSTIPNRTYPNAGIKINSPQYSLDSAGSHCTPLSNGFCMFSVSDTTPAVININTPPPDYIIVGVGTAGAVLASKLSDNNLNSVVALHNGPNLDNDPLITLSSNAILTVLSGLVGPPLYNASATVSQPDAGGRALRWVYALPLGGASAVNAGAWCRATNQVNSQWEALDGSNWSVANIQNVYTELENYTGETTNPAARGYQGPLPIRQESNPSVLATKFTQAIVNATGVSNVVDYNDPNTPIGVSAQTQYTQMGSGGPLRSSSAITFLNSSVMDDNGNGVNGRPLNVVFDATANNVIWNGNKAVGVTYYQNGVLHSIYANKGVIVSAGVKSSAFLLRSGVGPSSQLQALNIPVVYNNPNVGAGLADQPHVVLIYTTNPADTPSSALLQIFGSILSALATTDIGNELINYIGNSVDVQNGLFSSVAWLPAPGGDPTVRAVRIAVLNPVPGVAVVLVDLLQPASRGSIVLNSSDPFVEPTMDLGEFTNSADLTLYVNAIQTYVQGMNTALYNIDNDYELAYPESSVLASTPDLTNFILSEVGSDMHFQSHCRMAPLNQGGVVDNTGHVYGVQNLIVADDSIVPVPMDGSPMATAYLVAANIANIILG